MRSRSLTIWVMVVLFIVTCPTIVEAVPDWVNPNWDILDETYGNGAGQVSFVGSYTAMQGQMFTEVLYDGYATLSSDSLICAGKTVLPNMPAGDSDITIEYKVRDVCGNGIAAFFSQTNDVSTTLWQHVPLINYAGQDSISDYYGDDDYSNTNIAPVGFDGSATHNYRLVRQNHHSYFYLFDNETPVFICELGDGRSNTNTYVEFATPGNNITIDFYHAKVANGAYIPEPATLVLLGLGVLILRRKHKA
ncbi:MAG: PEP-CTERM sorting domain-containing protein [Sedimentisphaerales bacterium]|nr:PEP-CTERM sorting domain-containing protein [Sedimentisphaerales bacterium]